MKRSAQVALAVVTAATVGGTAYSMMAPERCAQAGGASAVNPSAASCSGGGTNGSGGGHGSRAVWGTSGGGATGAAATERGGFGSFARAIGAHLGG